MSRSKPQILFLAHRVPFPPNRGDRIRSFHLLRSLAERADVTLAFLADEPIADDTRAALEEICCGVLHVCLHPYGRWLHAAASVARGRTATEGLFYSRALRSQLRDVAKRTNYDAVFVFCSSMVQYLRIPGLEGTPAVIDLVDVDSQKWFDYGEKSRGLKSLLLRTEGQRLRRLEASLPEIAKAVTVVTDHEADLFQAFHPGYRPTVLGNGVDLDYFHPDTCNAADDSSADCHSGQSSRGGPVAVFIGALDYHANVDGVAWFCESVWPRVRRQFPDAIFRLVGSRPNARAVKLGNLPGVELIGQVDDVRLQMNAATAVVVPLRVARGVQNKVLEALAGGKATIVSEAALEGITAKPERDLLLARSEADWVDRIARVFRSSQLRRELRRCGRRRVEQHYRWSNQLETLWQTLAIERDHSDTRGCDRVARSATN
jgi:sugar transferase (PEP-CTERM/EpsH1 system associated)